MGPRRRATRGMKGLIITGEAPRRIRALAQPLHGAFGEGQSVEGRQRATSSAISPAGVPGARTGVRRLSLALGSQPRGLRPAGVLEYYRSQLRELLTELRDRSPRSGSTARTAATATTAARGERRRIDGSTCYDWPNTWKLVAELQPQRRDVQRRRARRALGRQREGRRLRDVVEPDHARRVLSRASEIHADRGGQARRRRTGSRPKWTSRSGPAGSTIPAEDAKVASVDKLIEIYEQSIGRGANLLLNIPPDRRGLIPDDRCRSGCASSDSASPRPTRPTSPGARRPARSQVRGGADRFRPRTSTTAIREPTGRPTMARRADR